MKKARQRHQDSKSTMLGIDELVLESRVEAYAYSKTIESRERNKKVPRTEITTKLHREAQE